MSSRRFPVLGEEIPPMLGRANIVRQMLNDLTKQTPSHLSVVGPRFSGKSVLLKALQSDLVSRVSPYCCVILWDLGHNTPVSNAEFIVQLCERIGRGLTQVANYYGEHLLNVGTDHYGEISEVIDALASEKLKLLMLWDGFEKALSSGLLTRNLWDNLLELCRKPAFRLVTSSRQELHRLIRDEKSVTSDFWGVFERVIKLDPFADEDVSDILTSVPELLFQSGAKKELLNLSGGYPPLFLAVLNSVLERKPRGEIDNADVTQAVPAAKSFIERILATLWSDLPVSTQDAFRLLFNSGELPVSAVGKEDRAVLMSHGFVRRDGNKLNVSCRLLADHIDDLNAGSGSMTLLFGGWEDYRRNIREMLERRFGQMKSFDDRLFRLVSRAIEDIPDYPDHCLNNLNHIEEKALDLIWERELGSSRSLPEEIVHYWTSSPRDGHKTINQMMEADDWIIPNERGQQLTLLQLLTGSHYDFKKVVAKRTSKDTYVLLNAIHSFRNRNQHAAGQEIHPGVAVAAIMLCIELLGCLEREDGNHSCCG